MDPPNVFNTLIDIGDIREKSVLLNQETMYEHYQNLKSLEEQILKFIRRIKSRSLTDQQKEVLERYSHAATSAMYACKYIKDISSNINEMALSKDPFVQQQYEYMQKELISLYRKFAESFGDIDQTQLANILVDHINRIFSYQQYLK
jgi:pyridoxal/pyridoxine/pyridoxamine kinase